MSSQLEILGFATGIAGVYLTARQNAWCFPIGLINVSISLYIFTGEKLLADALQQIVYLVLLVYGWWEWRHPGNRIKLPVTRLNLKEIVRLLCIIALFAFILGWVLHNFTDASLPWPDAAATATAFTAQYLVARKKIENWILWMPVNIAYICIYLYKDLPLYALLSLVYLLLAVQGWRNWRKELVR